MEHKFDMPPHEAEPPGRELDPELVRHIAQVAQDVRLASLNLPKEERDALVARRQKVANIRGSYHM